MAWAMAQSATTPSNLCCQVDGEPSTQGVFSIELSNVLFFFFDFDLLFIFCCVGSSFLCEGFLQLWRAGATPHRGARASHYGGLSCCGAQAPDAQAQ